MSTDFAQQVLVTAGGSLNSDYYRERDTHMPLHMIPTEYHSGIQGWWRAADVYSRRRHRKAEPRRRQRFKLFYVNLVKLLGQLGTVDSIAAKPWDRVI